jgi:D-alanyl-D-alanine carboxypeptidase
MGIQGKGLFQRTGALCLAFVMAAGGLLTPHNADARLTKKPAFREPALVQPFNPPTASFMMDAETGEVLSADNADAARYPASLTKIMTLILAFDAIREGRLKSGQEIRTPYAATRQEGHSSILGLRPGDKITVLQAVNALIVKSANDVAVTLGVAVARAHQMRPEEKSFVQMMNAKARGIGMYNTHFVNASGLHDPRQITTARDMAKLAKYLIDNYPDYYEYFSQQAFEYSGKQHRTHNHLMEQYPGMDGVKTGFLSTSGFNLVASAVHDGHRLIGVVFGGRTAAERDRQMADLLDAAFETIRHKNIAEASSQPGTVLPAPPEPG